MSSKEDLDAVINLELKVRAGFVIAAYCIGMLSSVLFDRRIFASVVVSFGLAMALMTGARLLINRGELFK